MRKQEQIEVLRQAMKKLEVRTGNVEQRASVPLARPKLSSWCPWGGFPRGALTEIRGRSGSLSLVAETLAAESHRSWVALVDASGQFYALGMNRYGLNWSQFCVVSPPEGKRTDWAVQQMSRSGLFSMVVLWGRRGKVDSRTGRTFLQAAEAGGTALVLAGAQNPLTPFPCALRLGVESVPGGGKELCVLRGAGRIGDTLQEPSEELWSEQNSSFVFSSLLFASRRSSERPLH